MVKGNFLDFIRGCSSIFGGWGVVLPERTGCQFRPPEGVYPLHTPPSVYCDPYAGVTRTVGMVMYPSKYF